MNIEKIDTIIQQLQEVRQEMATRTTKSATKTYRRGMVFRDMNRIYDHNVNRPEYILAVHSSGPAMLVHVETGEIYSEPVDVESQREISEEEFSKIAAGDEQDFDLIRNPNE